MDELFINKELHKSFHNKVIKLDLIINNYI
jgi:hypothetical protein